MRKNYRRILVLIKQDTDKKLSAMASKLRLAYTRDHLNEMINTITGARMTPREVSFYIFGKEIDQRESNRIRLATMAACFPRVFTLEGFDFDAHSSIDLGVIRELTNMKRLSSGENAMFLDPPGVGKTHLVIALGRQAIRKGHSILFPTEAKLMGILEKANNDSTLGEKISILNKPKLLIIDEVGY